MQLVAARCGLGEQVLVKKLIKMAAGSIEAGVIEGGGGVGVEAGAGDQAKAAVKPLLGWGQVGVGKAERSRDRQVFGLHQLQPVPGSGQAGGQARSGPRGMVVQPAAKHPDRQRQVPAQPGDLANCRVPGIQPGPGGQPDQQRRRLARRQDVEADHRRVFQRGQPTATGDQHQAARCRRQQRPDLLMPGRVIQHQQDLPAGHEVTPPGRTGFEPRWDLRRGEPGGQQQAGQRIRRIDRPLAGGVGVQQQEKLPVRKSPGQPVRGVHRERGLADPGHTADGMDTNYPATSRQAGQRPRQLRELSPAASEGGNIPWQGPGHRGLERSWLLAPPGRQNIPGQPAPAGCGDEQHTRRPGQAQRIGQQPGCVLMGGAVDSPFQVTDRPRGKPGRLCQFLLGQPGLGSQLPQ